MMDTVRTIEIIVTLPVGVGSIIFGLLLWKKQKIQWLHDYHHKHVQPQDIKEYTRLWGVGLIVFGVCISSIGILNYVFDTWTGWLLSFIGLVFIIIIGNKAQKTYNGSWFS